jgi:hypothetical protein
MRIVLLSALFAVSVFAQRSAAVQSRPAMASPPPPRMHSAAPAAPRPAPPAPIARPPYGAPRPYQPRSVIVPYPVFIGGGYGYGPGPLSDYSDANQSPMGIVNQDYRPDAVKPTIVDYSNASLPEPATDENGLRDDQPTIFLIALTDHTVVAAIAYWVDGDTLNWISRDAKQNRMSLSLIDRDFSKQLNDERHVEFKLPPAK